MAWALVQKVTNSTPSSDFLLNTAITLTAGNFLAVFVCIQSDPVTLSVTGGSLTYVQKYAARNAGSINAFLYVAENVPGGAVTVKAEGDHSFFLDIFMELAEFSGGVTSSSSSGTATTNTGTSTTPATGSMTPADADALLLASCHVSASGRTLTENAGSQGFTLLHENESLGGNAACGAVYKIISGGPSSANESWTISGANADWSAGLAAFKPAPSSGSMTPTAGSGALSGVTPSRIMGTIFTPYTP